MQQRFEVRLVGTGTAFNADGRASQAILVSPPAGPSTLVDVGQDTLVTMIRQGLTPASIDRVFITHLHGDHVAGWPFLLLHLAFEHSRSRRLDVYGPAGTEERLKLLMQACYPEIVPKLTFDVAFHEHPVAVAAALDGGPELTYDVVPLDHIPSSVGYRLRSAGRCLGISGDTGWCEGLERLAEGCDTLVLECTFLEKLPLAHVSLEELRAGRDRLRAGQIVLTHLPDAVADSLARDPLPGVLAGHDGLVIGI